MKQYAKNYVSDEELDSFRIGSAYLFADEPETAMDVIGPGHA